MIDIHSHILPGVDDGASSMKESLHMLSMARRQGITDVFATSHYSKAFPNRDPEKLRRLRDELMSRANRPVQGLEGKVKCKRPIRIWTGQEIFYSNSVIRLLEEGKLLTLADSNYVLVEFMPSVPYSEICTAVRNLSRAGYTPVVAHAERYRCLRKGKRVEELIDLEALIQMTLIPEDLFDTCVNMGITVHECLEDRAGWAGNQFINRMGGYTVLTSSVRVISSRQAVMKRTMDICGGIVGMILTGIITIFLAPAIYIASPGPIFFSQMRVGKNGKLFKIYKFRSMYMDAEERKKELMKQNEMKGLMFKMENDPRIIGSGSDGSKHGLGWFIRKTSLDEFPQFWNVLKGDMSLVGTRPPTVDEWKQYEPYHRGRLAVKPGLTGMWQVSGRSDITDFEEVVKLDMEYVKNWNIGMDIKILFKTVGVVLKGSGSK